MHRAFNTNIHLPYQHCAVYNLFIAAKRMGHQSVQRQSSDFTYELRDENQAEANIVVTIVRVVVVAICATAIPGVVVPATTTYNSVRTLDWCPYCVTYVPLLSF